MVKDSTRDGLLIVLMLGVIVLVVLFTPKLPTPNPGISVQLDGFLEHHASSRDPYQFALTFSQNRVLLYCGQNEPIYNQCLERAGLVTKSDPVRAKMVGCLEPDLFQRRYVVRQITVGQRTYRNGEHE